MDDGALRTPPSDLAIGLAQYDNRAFWGRSVSTWIATPSGHAEVQGSS